MRERQRFSIRKLGVGVGSVLIGLTIFATSGNVASADERQNKGDSFESVVSDKSVGEIGSPIQNDTEKPSEDEKGTIETAQQEIENVKAENTSEVSQEKSELSNESKEEVTQEETTTSTEDVKSTEEVSQETPKALPE
ncbi:MAG: YSIRK-type signal peptide-containing protein, partial [Staphylococcus equorum]|nr:YSIRK-type signal peptide-containing protein [Staphylococcus equorum]